MATRANEKEENLTKTADCSGHVEPVVMCACALLYNLSDADGLKQKVRACLVAVEECDDEFSLKAKAERYFREHETISKEIEGHSLVAYNLAIEAHAT